MSQWKYWGRVGEVWGWEGDHQHIHRWQQRWKIWTFLLKWNLCVNKKTIEIPVGDFRSVWWAEVWAQPQRMFLRSTVRLQQNKAQLQFIKVLVALLPLPLSFGTAKDKETHTQTHTVPRTSPVSELNTTLLCLCY